MRRSIAIILLVVPPLCLQAQPSLTPAWKLYYDSAQLFWSKDWNKTVPLLLQAEKSALYDLGIYDENYLTIINDLGLAYAKTGDYANAEKLLNKTISIKTELGTGSSTDLSRTLLNLATVHGDQGHVEQAEQIYKRVIAGGLSQSDPDVYTQAVNNLIALYETNNMNKKALSLADAQSAQFSKTNELPLLGFELHVTRGRLLRKLGQYDRAQTVLDSLGRELAARKDDNLSTIQIQRLQEIGLLDFETGLFHNAEKNLLQAFRLLKSQQPVNNAMLTELLNNLASVYEKIGLQEKAQIYYQDALALCVQTHGENSLYALTLQSNIAGIRLREGDVKLAVISFESIENKLRKIIPESNPFYITVLNNLATAYRTNKQTSEARATLDKAYALIKKYGLEKDDLAGSIMNNLAVLLTSTGDLEQAVVYYEKAYAQRKIIYGENSVLLMDIAGNMAIAYWELHKPERAIPLFQESIKLAIRQIKYIFPNLSEDDQVIFYKKLKEDFERFNTIAFQSATNRPELLTQVFNNQIIIKSLLFFTQRRRTDLITERRDAALTRQYDLLKIKREQLAYLYQAPLRDLSNEITSVVDVEKEIDVLEKSISLKTSETVAEKMQEQRIQWSDVQRKLDPDEALIDIIRFRKYDIKKQIENNASKLSFGFTDSVYYAALITTKETTTSPVLVLMKEGLNMETRFLNYYRNALNYAVKDENSYASYWKTFEPTIHNKKSIYLSGDGVYHRLNLNTLKEPVSDKFLIERYDIHYLLNPAQYLEKQKSSFLSQHAVLIGDPVFDMVDGDESKTRNSENFVSLPGTNTEVVKINEILSKKAWTTQVYLRKLATERNLKKVHSPAILHIATHGFFSTDKVKLSAEAKKDYLFYSGLVLSGANKSLAEETQEIYDDGILTAYEVMNLDLAQTHLVVLSACETGLGKIENGEGVYGLQRSFLQAGARNILISLWKVDDRITQELMVRFYQYLFQGKVEREALKLAQLDQLKQHPNPLGWGGFILVGMD
ncbi:MAG TPA: CHAT domain-containing tetratricopeptide repeat protein [Chryseolinea sp.]|nr:CHAT domain-containing tetratricopeptide repeat protein [Chryseolinea sp.]